MEKGTTATKAEAKRRIFSSIVVPAFDEEIGLPVVLEKIFRSVNGHSEVIVVDDGSQDATAEVASRFPCRVIRHERNRGKGEAMKTGIRHAQGECVIFIDADDTYPAQVLSQMEEALESYDVVYASRVSGRHNICLLNRIGNAILQNLVRRIYGFKPRDYSTGLYGMKKRYLEMMDISSYGFAIEPEIAIKGSRMKLRMKEIHIEYRPRLGKTKLNSLRAGFDHLTAIFGLLFWRSSMKTNAETTAQRAF